MSCWGSFWVGLGTGASGIIGIIVLILIIGMLVGSRR